MINWINNCSYLLVPQINKKQIAIGIFVPINYGNATLVPPTLPTGKESGIGLAKEATYHVEYAA